MTKDKMKTREIIKKIEYHLKRYKTYKAAIRNIEKQLDYIMPNITAVYEVREGTSGTFVITSSTEKCAIDRIESKRALDLHEEKARLELLVNAIETATADLEEEQKEYIMWRYEKGYSNKRIAAEMNCSESHVFKIRKELMDNLLISLGHIVTESF